MICFVAGHLVTSVQEGHSTATGTKIIKLNSSSDRLDLILVKQDEKTESKNQFKDFTFLNFSNCNWIKTIGTRAFCGCNNLTQIIFPSSVTQIEQEAFMGCTKLEAVTIPASVTVIEKHAFSNCLSLTQVIIPNSIKKIENSTFFNCMNLTQVAIPSSVRKIEEKAFSVCASLKYIELPASVTELGRQAFSLCRNLAQITIHGKIDLIGDETFEFCDSLKEVQWTRDHPSPEIIARFPERIRHIYVRFSPDHKIVFREVIKGGSDSFTESESVSSDTSSDEF